MKLKSKVSETSKYLLVSGLLAIAVVMVGNQKVDTIVSLFSSDKTTQLAKTLGSGSIRPWDIILLEQATKLIKTTSTGRDNYLVNKRQNEYVKFSFINDTEYRFSDSLLAFGDVKALITTYSDDYMKREGYKKEKKLVGTTMD